VVPDIYRTEDKRSAKQHRAIIDSRMGFRSRACICRSCKLCTT
jgi:hypothetical protein